MCYSKANIEVTPEPPESLNSGTPALLASAACASCSLAVAITHCSIMTVGQGRSDIPDISGLEHSETFR